MVAGLAIAVDIVLVKCLLYADHSWPFSIYYSRLPALEAREKTYVSVHDTPTSPDLIRLWSHVQTGVDRLRNAGLVYLEQKI